MGNLIQACCLFSFELLGWEHAVDLKTKLLLGVDRPRDYNVDH